jgi:predicted nucleic acid-binding protein
MRCIADANVLLPVLAEGHAHRHPALEWWDRCEDGDVGLCLPVRMAVLRLLSNARVMGSGGSVSGAGMGSRRAAAE